MWGSAFHFLPLWARPCLAVSTELHYFVSLYSSAFCVTHQSPFTAGSLTPIFFFFFFFFLVVVSADVGYLKEAALLYPSLPLCLGVCRLIKHNKGIATLHDIAGVRPYPTHLGIFVTAAAPSPPPSSQPRGLWKNAESAPVLRPPLLLHSSTCAPVPVSTGSVGDTSLLSFLGPQTHKQYFCIGLLP